MNKFCDIHTMENYSAIKRNGFTEHTINNKDESQSNYAVKKKKNQKWENILYNATYRLIDSNRYHINGCLGMGVSDVKWPEEWIYKGAQETTGDDE